MRNKLTRRMSPLLSLALALLACAPCLAQGPGRLPAAESRLVSGSDGLSLVNRIKGVESPAFRAYLYARVAAWLSQSAGKDQELSRLAADAAAAGVSDIHAHQSEIPPVPATGFHAALLNIVRRQSPEEAARLQQKYPLIRNTKPPTEAEKAGAALHDALAKVGDPQASAQSLEQATRLISAGNVPPSALHGEIVHLYQAKSPALASMLAAVVALEERKPGALPLDIMFFLSRFYLLDTTPAELQTRFLAATVSAVRLRLAGSAADPSDKEWAGQLLRLTLPAMQRLNPSMFAMASAQLAAVAPEAPQGDDVFARVRNSSDPLAQAVNEANLAGDARLKSQLFEMAARLAKEQGKLRQAVELLSSVRDERAVADEGYSSRDALFGDVLQEALKRDEIETARLAAAEMGLPANRAAALRGIARRLVKSGDTQAALSALGEASDALKGAKDGKEKAISYFDLAADLAGLDDARAAAAARDGIKAANGIAATAGPEKQPGAASWSLFPLADSVTKAFGVLARRDRTGALGIAETFQLKEFRIAAIVGVYVATP